MKIKRLLTTLWLSSIFALASCGGATTNGTTSGNGNIPSSSGTTSLDDKELYSAGGVLNTTNLSSYEVYENTPAHRKVSTYQQFLDAINDAKYTYTTTLNNDNTLSQTVTNEGTVHIIEIENDLDLGYEIIKDYVTQMEYTFVTDWANFNSYQTTSGSNGDKKSAYTYDPLVESGISCIEISRACNLLIYSKTGVKITHAGFKINSDYNLAVRNLKFDEMWMWEDSVSETPSKTIGDYDIWGWAYFKVSFSDNIWIDHCEFGKSFDGQIDVSNPTYNTSSTVASAPLNGSGYENVHISFCDFKSGDDDPNGYIYKMMLSIELDYQEWKGDKSTYTTTTDTCRYYRTLREIGASFDDILHGIAIPQKKGFLLGDTGNSGGTKVLTGDTTFQANKTYYKVTGFESSDGREKVGNTPADVTVGATIADATYEVAGRTISSYYEMQTPGPDYFNNLNLKVSFDSCKFRNIEDRLPNIRGGICYMYNSIVDASEYFTYRAKTSLQNCKSRVANKVASGGSLYTTNGKYKLALVSQGGVSCLGGSIYANTVMYKGIVDLVKNNNTDLGFSGNNTDYYKSGYKYENVYFSAGNQTFTGSTGENNPFSSVCKDSAYLSSSFFSYHNESNTLPFTIVSQAPSITENGLDEYFATNKAGTNINISYLKVQY